MTRALELAQKAASLGEVPVGAVLIKDGNVLGEGHNAPITEHDPSAHAEIMALRQAAQAQQNYRLPGTTLYTTLEPCAMCAGAIVHARIAHLVFAAHDPRAGAVESAFTLLNSDSLNHRVSYTHGILEPAASSMLRAFFQTRRGSKPKQ